MKLRTANLKRLRAIVSRETVRPVFGDNREPVAGPASCLQHRMEIVPDFDLHDYFEEN